MFAYHACMIGNVDSSSLNELDRMSYAQVNEQKIEDSTFFQSKTPPALDRPVGRVGHFTHAHIELAIGIFAEIDLDGILMIPWGQCCWWLAILKKWPWIRWIILRLKNLFQVLDSLYRV